MVPTGCDCLISQGIKDAISLAFSWQPLDVAAIAAASRPNGARRSLRRLERGLRRSRKQGWMLLLDSQAPPGLSLGLPRHELRDGPRCDENVGCGEREGGGARMGEEEEERS